MISGPLTKELGYIKHPKKGENLFDINIDDLIGLLRTHGIVLFSGFDLDLNQFFSFINQVGPSTPYVDVFTGYAELPYHAEFANLPARFQPDLIWFYCVCPSQEGGETMICDGVKIINEMDPGIKDSFSNMKVQYTRKEDPSFWIDLFRVRDLQQVIDKFSEFPDIQYTIDNQKTISTKYTTSAIKKSRLLGIDTFTNSLLHTVDKVRNNINQGVVWENGEKIQNDLIEYLKTLTDQSTVLLKWKKFDFAVIDNTRLMHGRRFYSDKNRQLKVAHTNIADHYKIKTIPNYIPK